MMIEVRPPNPDCLGDRQENRGCNFSESTIPNKRGVSTQGCSPFSYQEVGFKLTDLASRTPHYINY
jgi:hypothetical protein